MRVQHSYSTEYLFRIRNFVTVLLCLHVRSEHAQPCGIIIFFNLLTYFNFCLTNVVLICFPLLFVNRYIFFNDLVGSFKPYWNKLYLLTYLLTYLLIYLLATPKKDLSLRLIMDLSQPKGSSINENISKEDFSFQYSHFDEAVDLVNKVGKGALMSKLDVKHAYRLLPVRPDQWHQLCYFWEGNYSFSSYQSVRVTLWYPSYLIFCSSKEAEKILSLVGIQTFPGAGDSKWFNSIRWLSFHVSWWSTNMNWTHRTHCKYISFSHPTVGRSKMWNITYQPVIFFVRG